jgi:hypothetical protein
MYARRMLGLGCLLLALGAFASSGQNKTPDPVVEFTTACSCVLCHGSHRWSVKTEVARPPVTIPPSHQLTPSSFRMWKGPGGKIPKDAPRTGKEREWFSLTGEIHWAKIEDDGDIHLQLADRGADAGAKTASVEIPNGQPWCAMREQIFALTGAAFPIRFSSHEDLPLKARAVITVVGKAFYDAENDGGDSFSNDRDGADKSRTTVWEIHPVMKTTIGSR